MFHLCFGTHCVVLSAVSSVPSSVLAITGGLLVLSFAVRHQEARGEGGGGEGEAGGADGPDVGRRRHQPPQEDARGAGRRGRRRRPGRVHE